MDSNDKCYALDDAIAGVENAMEALAGVDDFADVADWLGAALRYMKDMLRQAEAELARDMAREERAMIAEWERSVL